MGVGLAVEGVLHIERRYGSIARTAEVLVAVDGRLVLRRRGEVADQVDVVVELVLGEIRGGDHGIGGHELALDNPVVERHLVDGQTVGLVEQVDAHGQTTERHLAAVGHLTAVGDDLDGFGRGHQKGVGGIGCLRNDLLLEVADRRTGVETLQGIREGGIGIGNEVNVETTVLGDVE